MVVGQIYMKLKDNSLKIRINAVLTFRDARSGRITDQIKVHNLAVNTGLYSIASRLSGVDIPENVKSTITYCAVGTGTDAPAAGDTELQTENTRKQVSVRSVSDAVAKFRTYFNTSDANAVLKEAGLFGDDATSTPDSGTLFCRLAINKTKTDAETLTIDWEVSVSAV